MEWRNSVLPYAIRDKFDELIREVGKETDYLNNLEEWDINEKKRYDCLDMIYKVYEECQLTQESDI